MKKFLLFLFLLVLLYLSAMFRSPALLTLFLMIVLAMPVFRLICGHISKRITAEFEKNMYFSVNSGEKRLGLKIINPCVLPVNRLGIEVSCGYGAGEEKRLVYYTAVSERSSDINGLKVSVPYCGIMSVKLKRLAVYDYLKVFKAKKWVEESAEIVVFPREEAMNIVLPAYALGGTGHYNMLRREILSGSSRDFKQLREYRSGDSARFIHWNQTAKTDQLWIKEYEKEFELSAEICLSGAHTEKIDEKRLSAFYEVLSALVLGLLRCIKGVSVSWLSDSGGSVSIAVGSEKECRDMLYSLYREGGGIRSIDAPLARDAGEKHFILDLDLRLHCGKAKVFEFTQSGYKDEIKSVSLTV